MFLRTVLAITFFVGLAACSQCDTTGSLPYGCVRISGSDIGKNAIKDVVTTGGTAQLALSNWVKAKGNKYTCVDYNVIVGDINCASAQLSNNAFENVAPNPAIKQAQYCASTDNIKSLVFCLTNCAPFSSTIQPSGTTEVCSSDTDVGYIFYPSTPSTFTYYLDGVAVAYNDPRYDTPNDLSVGVHDLVVVSESACYGQKNVSAAINVKQSPEVDVSTSLNLDSGVVDVGQTLVVDWESTYASVTAVQYYHDNVLVSTHNALTGSFTDVLAAGQYKIVITLIGANGCNIGRSINFVAVDPNSLPQLDLSYNPPLINGTHMSRYTDYTIVFSSPNVTFQVGDHFLMSAATPPYWDMPYPFASYPAMPVMSFYWWSGNEQWFNFYAKAIRIDNDVASDLTETIYVQIPLV